MSERVALVVNGSEYELPIIQACEGDDAIEIRRLRNRTGLIAYDPGLANTGSCQSKITFFDGEQGILRYRDLSMDAIESHPK